MPTEILLVLGLVGLIFLLLIVAVVVFMRRRAAQSQPKKKAAAPPKKGQPRQRPSAMQSKQTPAAKVDPPTKAAPPPAASTPPPAAPSTSKPAQPQPPVAVPATTGASPAPLAETTDKIRILIVDDNPDTRENVSRLLYFEDNLDVIGQAVNGREGIEMATELRPHVVLMDINMPDMDGITATEKMSVQVPYCQVIIMSVQAEQDYMKRAMAAGARDFQPKPFTADELINCIHRVYQIGIPIYQKIEAAQQIETQTRGTAAKAKKVIKEGDAPVIAVYSGKGGVGTSAVAANLAVALQQYRGDVALMDADLQFGDISVNLNTRPNRNIADLVHEGEVDVELLPDVVLAHDTGLKLLLAPPEPQLADTILPGMVADIVKELKNLFKVIVIDTNSQLNDVTLNVLEHADYVLVVTAPELPAIKSAKSFLELAAKLEFPAEKLGVVINRANEPGGVRPGQIAKVLKLEQPFLVPDEARLHMAMYKGVTIIQEDANAPASKAFRQIATDIWQKLAGPEEEELVEAEEIVA